MTRYYHKKPKSGSNYVLINPAIIRTEKRKLRAFQRRIDMGCMTKHDALQQYRGVRGMIASHENTYHILGELDNFAKLTIGW